jgi:hypothetical protein
MQPTVLFQALPREIAVSVSYSSNSKIIITKLPEIFRLQIWIREPPPSQTQNRCTTRSNERSRQTFVEFEKKSVGREVKKEKVTCQCQVQASSSQGRLLTSQIIRTASFPIRATSCHFCMYVSAVHPQRQQSAYWWGEAPATSDVARVARCTSHYENGLDQLHIGEAQSRSATGFNIRGVLYEFYGCSYCI